MSRRITGRGGEFIPAAKLFRLEIFESSFFPEGAAFRAESVEVFPNLSGLLSGKVLAGAAAGAPGGPAALRKRRTLF
ncbi:MAG: hypothetical protein LBR53_08065 [Deltaproteobacteria bacterium]|nr:hypothetical protein [Deltaproteobacteria bacterium]